LSAPVSPAREPEVLVSAKAVTQKVRKTPKSASLYDEARGLIPGGSSSVLRWASYEPYPVYLRKGEGSHITDVDDNSYIDYLMAYGALINGHSHPKIVAKLAEQLQYGTMLGAPDELEVKLARLFRQFVPTADLVIFGNSGMDATANAIRIARAATGKDVILKFEGHYHGQHDYMMISVEAPPSVAGLEDNPRPLPYSAGIPSLVLDTVIVAPWNNQRALERIMKRYRNEVAAIIMEPVMANSTVIPPSADYLKAVSEIASSNDSLLIFDEVISGFRVAPGGAQDLYGVRPDLSTWGKALGGGLPISAVSGKREYMELIGPGKVSYGGTYFANALSLAGAIANLDVLAEHNYAALRQLKDLTEKLTSGLAQLAERAGHKVCVQSVPGMFTLSFTKQQKIMNYRESLLIDWNKYKQLHQLLLDLGVYVHPDNYERVCLSTAHTAEDIAATLAAFEGALRELRDRYS
jgi:glutamate-1-semialdehyde 2,1-aminomutase